MATPIIGIPTTRVSDLFMRQRLLNQVQADQADLYRIQTQLSTGRRFEAPSEDPVAALRVMSLQSLLERKKQVRNNLNTNTSYLSATDAALSSVAGLLAAARGNALGVLGTTATDTERAAAAQQIGFTIQQLLETGNQKFRGRYLFAGSQTTLQPLRMVGNGLVEYDGNETGLSSYADVDLLFSTTLTGSQVFGAISQQVEGARDLNPALTYDTRLADLRGGQGISRGSIAVSDGDHTRIVDLSGAATIGDVAAMIRANPPQGRSLNVEITATGLTIQLDAAPGNLSIREVGGGTTAGELGILKPVGVGNNPIVGRDLNPLLRTTTALRDICGVRASTVIRSLGADNDFILEADVPGEFSAAGAALNGVTLQFVDDEDVTAGNEVVVYDPDAKSIVVRIDAGRTQAQHVVEKLNAAYQAGEVPFTAHLDPLDETNGGTGLVSVAAVGTTQGGSGTPFDQLGGLRIVNRGETFTISLESARTIEDVLNLINRSGAGVLAEINAAKTGINIRSRTSGSDFSIGENGGTTATQLGLRTFTEATLLSGLNYGRGVADYAGSGSQSGIDFTVTRADGVELAIDVAGAETIGDVLAKITSHPDNADGLLVARLAKYGNGIELLDNTLGAGSTSVRSADLSTAAADLGLVPPGQQESGPTSLNDTATLVSAAPKSNLIFRGVDPACDTAGVTVIFDGLTSGVDYNEAARTLTIGITPGETTAAEVIAAMEASPAGRIFTATLDPDDDPPNDGSGVVDATQAVMTPLSGGPQALTGGDAHPLETEGVFTALLRLQQALRRNDLPEIQRAIELLDQATETMNFSRAELGARQQGLDVLQRRLDTEEIELSDVLSLDYDADLVQVVSDLTARQTAMEASLRATAQMFQMSLLNYL